MEDDYKEKLPTRRVEGGLASVAPQGQFAPTTRQFLGLLIRAGTAGLNRQAVQTAIEPALKSLTGAKSREAGLAQFHQEASTSLEAAIKAIKESPGADFHAGVDLAKPPADLFAEIRSIVEAMSDNLAHHATHEVRKPNVEALMGAHNGRVRIELNLLQLELIFATERLASDRDSPAARASFLDALGALIDRLKTSFLAD